MGKIGHYFHMVQRGVDFGDSSSGGTNASPACQGGNQSWQTSWTLERHATVNPIEYSGEWMKQSGRTWYADSKTGVVTRRKPIPQDLECNAAAGSKATELVLHLVYGDLAYLPLQTICLPENKPLLSDFGIVDIKYPASFPWAINLTRLSFTPTSRDELFRVLSTTPNLQAFRPQAQELYIQFRRLHSNDTTDDICQLRAILMPYLKILQFEGTLANFLLLCTALELTNCVLSVSLDIFVGLRANLTSRQ